jgi:hypothetical protein
LPESRKPNFLLMKFLALPFILIAIILYFQGGLFAADSPYYLWLVPTLAHSIIVNIINQLYSKVAEKCTDLENHR